VSYVKALVVLVSSSIICFSYAGFQKIIDINIVNNNVSGPKIYSWGMPLFIGNVYHCTSSSLTDCLWIVEYYCVRCISVSSIPMAPGYLTDPFASNNSVHDCYTCNCTNIPVKKYNLFSCQCKFNTLAKKIVICLDDCLHLTGRLFRLLNICVVVVVVVVVVIVRTLSQTIRFLLLLLLLLLCRSG